MLVVITIGATTVSMQTREQRAASSHHPGDPRCETGDSKEQLVIKDGEALR